VAATISADPFGTRARTLRRKYTRHLCHAAPSITAAMAAFEALVGVGDDQTDAARAPGPQAAQERRPERSLLAVAHGQAQHLSVAVPTHAGGDDDGLGHHVGAVVGFDVGGVEEDVRELDVGQRAIPKAGHDVVELAADATDAGLGNARVDAQRRHQIVDSARRHPVHVGLHDHGPQGPVDASSGLEQGREERARAQLGDAQAHVAGLGGQQPGPAAVALGGTGGGALVAVGTDDLGGFHFDEGLQHQLHGFAQDVEVPAGTERVEEFGKDRLIGPSVATSLRNPDRSR